MKRTIAAQIPSIRGRAGARIATLSSGTAVNQAILVLSLPLVSRLFAPNDFGAWAVIRQLFLALGVLGTLRLEFAVVLAKSSDETKGVLRTAIAAMMTAALVTIIAVAAIGGWLASLLEIGNDRVWLWSIPLLAMSVGLIELSSQLMLKDQRAVIVTFALLSQGSATVAFQILFGSLFGGTVGWLVAGALVGHLGSVVLLWAGGVRMWPRPPLSKQEWLTSRSLLGKYKDFPLYVAPYSFVGAAGNQVVLLLIGSYGDLATVGLFAMALRLAHAPLLLLARSIRQVFFPMAAAADEVADLTPFVARALRLLALCLIPPALVAIRFRTALVDLLLGPEWSELDDILLIVTLPLLSIVFSSWLDRLYHVLGRQRLSLIMESAYAMVMALALLVVGWFGASALGLILTYAVIVFGYNITWLVVTLRIAGMPVVALLRQTVPGIALGFAVWLVLWMA